MLHGLLTADSLPRSAFHLMDCSEGDRPRRMHKPAPYEPEQLGISRARFRDTFAKIPYMRSRFSNIDIVYRFGLMDEWLERLFGKGGIWEVR